MPLLNEPPYETPWKNAQFGGGLYQEHLKASLRENYEKRALGWAISIGHALNETWQGNVDLRWGTWSEQSKSSLTEDSSAGQKISKPIALFSKIEWAPLFSGASIFEHLKPFLSWGMGVHAFREKWQSSLTKDAGQAKNTEFSVSSGFGLRFGLGDHLDLKTSMDWWRGVKTSYYGGTLLRAEIVVKGF